jgi:hypothetical protein
MGACLSPLREVPAFESPDLTSHTNRTTIFDGNQAYNENEIVEGGAVSVSGTNKIRFCTYVGGGRGLDSAAWALVTCGPTHILADTHTMHT